MSEVKIHGLSAEGEAYRAALVAIQELAVGFQDWNPMDSRDAGEVYAASSVEDLLDDIRRLADDALGGDNNG